MPYGDKEKQIEGGEQSLSRGFYVAKIVVTGEDRTDASVSLRPGANVITGLSDTGKSFIFDCINHAFGNEDELELPDEGEGYTHLFVQLSDFDDTNAWTIKRAFNDNSVQIFDCAYDRITSKTELRRITLRHNEKKETLSSFLLNLAGFPSNVHLKANDEGVTSVFSLRVLWPFFAVDEITILTKKSPVFNELVFNKTKQRNSFEYLFTGQSVSQQKKVSTSKKVDEGNLAGQLEFCRMQISELSQRETNLELSKTGYGTVDALESEIADLTQNISDTGEKINAKLMIRNKLLGQLELIEAKANSVAKMTARFSLLKEHYQSDLSRLDFVSEGHFLLSQLQKSMCPTCGQAVGDEKHSHGDTAVDEELLQLACKSEIEKITRHLRDLEKTFLTLEKEATKLNSEAVDVRFSLAVEEAALQNSLSAQWTADKAKLQELMNYQRVLGELAHVRERLQALRISQAELQKKSTYDVQVAEVEVRAIQELMEKDFAKEVQKLANKIENLLKNWHFSNDQVTFDTKTLDIKVGTKSRKTYGSGKRAVLYAAYLIGLMNHLISEKMPHPRFVLIDSPLTNHKGKKKLIERGVKDAFDEIIPEEVKDAFFEFLSRIRLDRQVIILDNEIPSMQYQKQINTIIFTGEVGNGRYGFFPN